MTQVWWLWTAYDPPKVHVLDVLPEFVDEEGRLEGEGGWTALIDNMGLGIRTAQASRLCP